MCNIEVGVKIFMRSFEKRQTVVYTVVYTNAYTPVHTNVYANSYAVVHTNSQTTVFLILIVTVTKKAILQKIPKRAVGI